MSNWLLVILFGSTLACANAANLPEPIVISERNQEQVLKHLRPVLMARGGAGRIYYSTVCLGKDFPLLPFPELNAVPSQRREGLAAVRDIFRNDKRVRVLQDRSGMIRVTIGQPATALLQTRIGSVTFKSDEQYNGELAKYAVLKSKEVQAAMRQLGLEGAPAIFSGSITVPEAGRQFPHLPASIKNQTMDQALDTIAQTFKGIVIYKTCAEPGGKRLVSLDFVQVADF
jgi:hypothetical protein